MRTPKRSRIEMLGAHQEPPSRVKEATLFLLYAACSATLGWAALALTGWVL